MNKHVDIDFVVLWVDGSDPEWIKEFNKYSSETKKQSDSDVRAERYRDYGLLKYWFRGIEMFAPWVRKVHFVTCGQKPDWLNVNNPKLQWVKHEDYIPSKYLPVFSCNPIEDYMHNIPDLAEHFVFFNDDFFLTAPIKESYYFKNGLPCDYTGFSTIGIGASRIPHMVLNDLIEINKNFNRKQVLKNHFTKWYSLKNGNNLLKTICTMPFQRIDGIVVRHYPQPYTKSTFTKVWEKCPEVLNKTMEHRFRNRLEDVNQWLFRFWNLCEGKFYPKNCYKYEHFIRIAEMKEKDVKAIKNQKYKVVCINDDLDEKECNDYEVRMKKLVDAFESILPNKSSFEL